MLSVSSFFTIERLLLDPWVTKTCSQSVSLLLLMCFILSALLKSNKRLLKRFQLNCDSILIMVEPGREAITSSTNRNDAIIPETVCHYCDTAVFLCPHIGAGFCGQCLFKLNVQLSPYLSCLRQTVQHVLTLDTQVCCDNSVLGRGGEGPVSQAGESWHGTFVLCFVSQVGCTNHLIGRNLGERSSDTTQGWKHISDLICLILGKEYY